MNTAHVVSNAHQVSKVSQVDTYTLSMHNIDNDKCSSNDKSMIIKW